MANLIHRLKRVNLLKPFTRVLAAVHLISEVQREQLRVALLNDPTRSDPKRLQRHELRCFSQNGEDGILAEIFHRIGTDTRIFAEFGVGDGLECNSAYLLLQGWQGFWFDGGDELEAIERNAGKYIAAHRLVVGKEMFTAENARDVFEKWGVPRNLDLLSVDIDRNTPFVWQALAEWRPRVAVIEYNPAIAPSDSWQVAYRADLAWDGTGYYGASLLRLEELGRELGYRLVGCDLAGVNAFFVRDDLVGDRFCEPFTAANHYEPSRPSLGGRRWWCRPSFGDCDEAFRPGDMRADSAQRGV